MTPPTEEQTRPPLFGREPDLAYLTERCTQNGVTAILARPQMGKSSLLNEFAIRRARHTGNSSFISLTESYLVGSAESFGETEDLLLRAVVDLYTRWLSDSTYRQQAQVVYRQHNKDWIGTAGTTVGIIFEKLSKLSKPTEPIGGLVKEAFDGLVKANAALTSGNIELPRLQVEQAKDLLAMLHQITGSRLVLILDQWEKSTGIQKESNVLDTFLRHTADWPPCHILLGVRSGENVKLPLHRLERDFAGLMERHELQPMQLDEAETQDLLAHLRDNVPASRETSDEQLIAMLAGYPGTLAKWTDRFHANKMKSTADLETAAAEANANRFTEFETLLFTLSEDQRQLSMRIVLTPGSSNADTWSVLEPLILGNVRRGELDTLKRLGILEAASPPGYGHAKRYEAAIDQFQKDYSLELADVAEVFILDLAGKIRNTHPESEPFSSALVEIGISTAFARLSQDARVLCSIAGTLFDRRGPDPDELLLTVNSLAKKAPPASALLSIGLFNVLYDVKAEEDPARRDALLDQLRRLANDYPGDAAVRDRLAKGLFNTLIDAKVEDDLTRRDALLDELRSLANDYPGDDAVREELAKGLFNTLIDAKVEDDLTRRDALLDELRSLANDYPGDDAVREELARGLFNTLNDARAEQDVTRRDALLDELRSLANDYPGDAAVRESLARSLFMTLDGAKAEEDLTRREALLDELRSLASDYPSDDAVRERLAKGLFNTLDDARAEDDLTRRDALLDELRSLANDYPGDAAIREPLARGLLKTMIDTQEEQDLERCDSLRDELQTLAHAFPDDETLGQILDIVQQI